MDLPVTASQQTYCEGPFNQNRWEQPKQAKVFAKSLFGLKYQWNIISNTPLFCLDTSFCLHIHVWVCSFNHSLTAKKWWINDKLWEEEDSIPYPIYFSFKRNFKCSHRYTNIPDSLYSACLSGRTRLKIETVFSYHTKPPVWSCWII